MTAHTATTIDTLTTAITGKATKRASTKAAAIERFVDAAADKGIDGEAVLASERPLEALTGMMAEKADVAEAVPHIPLRGSAKAAIRLVEAAAPAAAEKPARKEPKTAGLIRRAKNGGITNKEMRELTGWTKLGGFFNAAKKAGLALSRVRENGDTRWTAS